MKTLLLSLLAATLVAPAAFAQDADPDAPAVIEDEVIVEGVRRGADDAMAAWLRGDYATAEIEFEKNFSRLKRFESLRRSSIEQNASDAILGEVNAGINTGSGGGQGTTQAETDVAATASSIYTNKRFRPGDDDPNLISSGNDLGGQLYMAGMSELQLGKYAEAKESFERALFFNETLHDARLRLGLLAVQEGDMKEANKQLAKLEKGLRGCKSRCERFGDREILENGIAQLKQFTSKQG